MPQLSSFVVGAAVASLTFGAVQFASGSDLGKMQLQTVASASHAAPSAKPQVTGVNRAGKSDRGALSAQASAATKTVAVHLSGMSETSILIRMPTAAAIERPASPSLIIRATSGQKPTVACEPPVSVLTEVAKALGPGRCVT